MNFQALPALQAKQLLQPGAGAQGRVNSRWERGPLKRSGQAGEPEGGTSSLPLREQTTSRAWTWQVLVSGRASLSASPVAGCFWSKASVSYPGVSEVPTKPTVPYIYVGQLLRSRSRNR